MDMLLRAHCVFSLPGRMFFMTYDEALSRLFHRPSHVLPSSHQIHFFFPNTDEKNKIVFSHGSWAVEKMVVLVHLLYIRKARRLWPRHVFCSSALLFLPSGSTAFFILLPLRYTWFPLKYDHVFEETLLTSHLMSSEKQGLMSGDFRVEWLHL